MEAFVKSFATYRTVKKSTVLSSALTLDSLDKETSTVTVKGTNIGRSNTGDWLIVDGQVYRIAQVKPQTDRTMLTLNAPLEAFSRSLEYTERSGVLTIGDFVAKELAENWVKCDDPVYAMAYLTVSNSDPSPFAPPELDNAGCYDLAAYCRLMRKSYRVKVSFTDAGDSLRCTIARIPEAARKVSFEDGRSQLQSVDYSSSGVAKITVLYDADTGERDEEGEIIYERQRSDWYLSESGEVSQSIPARRASGTWSTLSLKGNVDIQAKVTETFAKNKANHKLEFWSSLDLNIQDDCTFQVYGEPLYSYISYKRKSSEDRRYYYRSGELATTATEKLRRMTNE